MKTDANRSPGVPITIDGQTVLLPPDLMRPFEEAERQLEQAYGIKPGVTALLRLWLACGTSSQIRIAYERTRRRAQRPEGRP